MNRIRYQLDILGLVGELEITTLAALHDLNLAAGYCDLLYVMNAGRVVASGPPAEVLTTERITTVFGVHADPLIHPSTGKLHLAFSPAPPETETNASNAVTVESMPE